MGILLRVLVAAGLAVDAYIHWDFAADLPSGKDGNIGADVLFQAQAVAAVVVGLLVLCWARRWTYAVAFLVAASALGAVLLYYAVDVGSIGPLPELHEPVWYTEKTVSAIGEGVAALAALVGFFTVARRSEEHRAEMPAGR
jgi:hypothetical protein